MDEKEKKAIMANIDKSALVVEGTVASVRDIPEARLRQAAGGRRPITEHDPKLREAVVDVTEVQKGELKGDNKKVVVVFSSSNDPYNRDRPKFNKGDKGLMILHKDEIKSPQAKTALLTKTDAHEGEIYSAIEPHNFIKVDPKKDPEGKRVNAAKSLIKKP
jgi:hypothetical protein